MKFWPNFFGSFCNPRVYVDARLIYRGYGVRYSIALVALGGIATLAYLLLTTTFTTPSLHDLKSVGIIFVGMALLRAAMLIPLLIACCLLGYLFKLRLTYSQGARLTAIAYTPVAVFDAIAFNGFHYGVSPPLLFGCGVMMLLAAVHAAK